MVAVVFKFDHGLFHYKKHLDKSSTAVLYCSYAPIQQTELVSLKCCNNKTKVCQLISIKFKTQNLFARKP